MIEETDEQARGSRRDAPGRRHRGEEAANEGGRWRRHLCQGLGHVELGVPWDARLKGFDKNLRRARTPGDCGEERAEGCFRGSR